MLAVLVSFEVKIEGNAEKYVVHLPQVGDVLLQKTLFLKLRFFLFTTTRSKPHAEILFMSGSFSQSTPETSEDLVFEFDQL